MRSCIKAQANWEVKSFGFLSLSKFCLRKNFIFLEIANKFLPQIFALFSLYLKHTSPALWASL